MYLGLKGIPLGFEFLDFLFFDEWVERFTRNDRMAVIDSAGPVNDVFVHCTGLKILLAYN